MDDQDRADKTIKGVVGKRLTYRTPDGIAPRGKVARREARQLAIGTQLAFDFSGDKN